MVCCLVSGAKICIPNAKAWQFAKKQQKKDEKQNKKLAKHAAKAKQEPEVKTNIESPKENTDKIVNIEDRIHD